ncbi:Hypothetical protein NTJ_15422 [Nesidiocoris tenuis]|uniref:Uncharacterized protein n=1 Tax=Nesidiocoris tenuis TaxID=355587 RepID=A0ABN7BH95_9HEMI|nr:Hypothetical protein NTJ_15422 [Nesidiocoris tenuis]
MDCGGRCLHELVAADAVADVRAACQSDAGRLDHRNDDLETPLHVAAVEGSSACADVLLSSGADPFARDVDGYTPLMLACKFARLEAARLLVKFGGLDLKDAAGRTALHISAAAGELRSAQLLLDSGADADALDDEGNLPVHVAVRRQNLDVAWAICKKMDLRRYLKKNFNNKK